MGSEISTPFFHTKLTDDCKCCRQGPERGGVEGGAFQAEGPAAPGWTVGVAGFPLPTLPTFLLFPDLLTCVQLNWREREPGPRQETSSLLFMAGAAGRPAPRAGRSVPGGQMQRGSPWERSTGPGAQQLPPPHTCPQLPWGPASHRNDVGEMGEMVSGFRSSHTAPSGSVQRRRLPLASKDSHGRPSWPSLGSASPTPCSSLYVSNCRCFLGANPAPRVTGGIPLPYPQAPPRWGTCLLLLPL